MSDYAPSADFMKSFREQLWAVEEYIMDTITWLNKNLNGLDAIFGPSSIMSLIHDVQLELSGADLSFTAPLSLSSILHQGPLRVSDMFKLYRFENMLYSMELSGKEINGFLEYAAGIWFHTMRGPEDHLLQFREDGSNLLTNPYYNFSSAAGIDYTIDLSKPPGERITIEQFSNGKPFHLENRYLVALNSYRGNGGGGHLTKGAGIKKQELADRIRWSSDVDLRYYIMETLSGQDTLYPETFQNWKITPSSWVEPAAQRDRKLLE
jgi:2',3'-cyclic-nucleotide 2'-phosphodiesterase/3'-nucleotidase